MSTFFDSFEPPKQQNEEQAALPEQMPGNVPNVVNAPHTQFYPSNYFYLFAGLGLIILVLVLHLVADWPFGRIFWGSFLPVGLGIATYRYITPPYQDIRMRQLGAVIGFGLVLLLVVIYHILIPLVNSNQPVHLYLLAIIAALGVVSWFFYRSNQHYRALGSALLTVLLLITTLSFWHKWTGKYHDTSQGDSWTKYSVFGKKENAATRRISPPISNFKKPSESNIYSRKSSTEKDTIPEIKIFYEDKKEAVVVMDNGDLTREKVGSIFFWKGMVWTITHEGNVRRVDTNSNFSN